MVSIEQEEKKALLDAFRLAGSQAALARMLGLAQQSVNAWLRTGLPVKRVIEVEKVLKGKISRYNLKPSLFLLQKNYNLL